jgi:hypothetical protein
MSTQFRASCAFTGVGTYVHTVQTAGVIKAFGALTDINGFSGITFTLQHNGSTIATATTTTATNLNSINLNGMANCAIGDTITFIITSSQTDDLVPNAIKGCFTISQ